MSDRSVIGPATSSTSRRSAVLQAAFELFTARGFAAARIEDIARRAHVGKGTVLLYFPTKESLFATVIETYALPAVVEVERLADASETAAVLRIKEFAEWLHRQLSTTPLGGVLRLIVVEARNFPDLTQTVQERLLLRAQRALSRIFEQGMKAGELRALEPDLAAQLLVQPILFRAIWRQSFAENDTIDEQRWLNTHLAIFSQGVLREEI